MKYRLAGRHPFKGFFHAKRTASIWVTVDSRKIATCHLDTDAMTRREAMAAGADRNDVFAYSIRLE